MAALRAAASRVGVESFAAIEPETSSTSTTVASCFFTVIVAFGRANPTSSRVRPASNRIIGAWRRHAGGRAGEKEDRGRGGAPRGGAADLVGEQRRRRPGGSRCTPRVGEPQVEPD